MSHPPARDSTTPHHSNVTGAYVCESAQSAVPPASRLHIVKRLHHVNPSPIRVFSRSSTLKTSTSTRRWQHKSKAWSVEPASRRSCGRGFLLHRYFAPRGDWMAASQTPRNREKRAPYDDDERSRAFHCSQHPFPRYPGRNCLTWVKTVSPSSGIEFAYRTIVQTAAMSNLLLPLYSCTHSARSPPSGIHKASRVAFPPQLLSQRISCAKQNTCACGRAGSLRFAASSLPCTALL